MFKNFISSVTAEDKFEKSPKNIVYTKVREGEAGRYL